MEEFINLKRKKESEVRSMTTLEFIEQYQNILECSYEQACKESREFLVTHPTLLYGIEISKGRAGYDSGTTRAI